MTTTFDPPELERLASLLAEALPVVRGFHRSLLGGKQDWNLRNFVAPTSGDASYGSEGMLRAAEGFRAELTNILASRGIRVRRRHVHARITARPEPLAPYTVPVPRKDVREVEGHVVLWAFRTEHPGCVPIHRCGLLNTRCLGGERSTKVEYVVGRPGFNSVPEDWCLRADLEEFLNEMLSNRYRFKRPSDAVVSADQNEQPYIYFDKHRRGEIDVEDVDLVRYHKHQLSKYPLPDEDANALLAEITF